MTAAATFFNGFTARKWRPPPFFCGFVAEKVTTTMWSPSSMVAVFLIFSLLLLMV
jgi:hypothetical protein